MENLPDLTEQHFEEIPELKGIKDEKAKQVISNLILQAGYQNNFVFEHSESEQIVHECCICSMHVLVAVAKRYTKRYECREERSPERT